MHAEARQWIAANAPTITVLSEFRVIEIGGYNVNGSIRDLFDGASYLSVDIREGPGVDEVHDASLPAPGGIEGLSVDVVVCCEVLEHAADPAGIIANAMSILKPGGLFLMTCATDPRAPHGNNGAGVTEGEHYANIDPIWFESQVEPYQARVEVHSDRGDLYAAVTK
jgi:SAM-dependent methyltransferase